MQELIHLRIQSSGGNSVVIFGGTGVFTYKLSYGPTSIVRQQSFLPSLFILLIVFNSVIYGSLMYQYPLDQVYKDMKMAPFAKCYYKLQEKFATRIIQWILSDKFHLFFFINVKKEENDIFSPLQLSDGSIAQSAKSPYLTSYDFCVQRHLKLMVLSQSISFGNEFKILATGLEPIEEFI